jgi:Protein of unknown function (DUF2577)
MAIDKRTRLEGSSTSQLYQLIRRIGYNRDVEFIIGTVTAVPPDIKVRLDGVDAFELDRDDLIVAQDLTTHTRSATINGSTETITLHSPLKAGDRVIIACMDDEMRFIVLDKAVT